MVERGRPADLSASISAASAACVLVGAILHKDHLGDQVAMIRRLPGLDAAVRRALRGMAWRVWSFSSAQISTPSHHLGSLQPRSDSRHDSPVNRALDAVADLPRRLDVATAELTEARRPWWRRLIG